MLEETILDQFMVKLKHQNKTKHLYRANHTESFENEEDLTVACAKYPLRSNGLTTRAEKAVQMHFASLSRIEHDEESRDNFEPKTKHHNSDQKTPRKKTASTNDVTQQQSEVQCKRQELIRELQQLDQ